MLNGGLAGLLVASRQDWVPVSGMWPVKLTRSTIAATSTTDWPAPIDLG